MMSAFPKKISLKLGRPLYVGSVQRLYNVPGHPDLIISETSSGGSVFDVGTIFSIEGSDTGRAGFRHLVFQELQNPKSWKRLAEKLSGRGRILEKDKSGVVNKVLTGFIKSGAPTHHAGMVERKTGKVYAKGFPSALSNLTLIRKFTVEKPVMKNFMGSHFYDYEKYHHIDRNVIPLEYIVRLGVTTGSSILKKYDRLSDSDRKAYLSELGVGSLSPWTRFNPPIVDLTTKYEPEDRNISRQEASMVSGVDGDTFSRSLIMAVLGAYMLQQVFDGMGLSLWDLKWEIARDGKKLLFVDTIDTDSVRVTFNMKRNGKSYFVHFNKQAMRDYYRIMHPDWISAVNESKKIAAQSGRAFTDVLKEGQSKKKYAGTPVVDKSFLNIQTEKFLMIQRYVIDSTQDLRAEARRIAKKELDYYVKSGKIKEYEKINSR
ncbi:MAG: phosphoribosylaminoimidazolesuccinocarboxamide synthase [Nitrospirota bacterium]